MKTTPRSPDPTEQEISDACAEIRRNRTKGPDRPRVVARSEQLLGAPSRARANPLTPTFPVAPAGAVNADQA